MLSVGLLVYLLSQQGWAEIISAARQIAWWRFVLAFILVMISRLAVAGRWHVLMHSAGTGITLRQSMRLTFAMLFASNFLPTTIGGDVVRLAGAIRLGFDQAISVASWWWTGWWAWPAWRWLSPLVSQAMIHSQPILTCSQLPWQSHGLIPCRKRCNDFLQRLTQASGNLAA